MKVIVAEKRGFCPGVRQAINTAEQILAEPGKGPVYSLGPVIHNPDEVDRLGQSGLKTVAGIDEIESGTVLIRSHGAAPDELQALKDRGLEVVDATCVLVKRLQNIAKELEDQGYQVIIIGETDHPEVRAVSGFVTHAIVVSGEQDLPKVPREAKLGVVCQTTLSLEYYGCMLGALGQGGFREIKAVNTLCRESCKRQDAAVELCQTVDIMFVLGGLHSSNTRRLAELCKKLNSCTYHLQRWEDLDTRLLEGKRLAGVTAGASTPDWIINAFVGKLEEHGS
jgi:4-hydroxy-3-methylbut-2-enyl diphosphate reductase